MASLVVQTPEPGPLRRQTALHIGAVLHICRSKWYTRANFSLRDSADFSIFPVIMEGMLTMMAFFDDLRMYRERAGLSINRLARAADVDRATVSRAERHQPVRKELLARIGDALNDSYYSRNGAPIDFYMMITERSRFGRDARNVA